MDQLFYKGKLKMPDETHFKKSRNQNSETQNRNSTKSRNSAKSPELCRISGTGDVLKGPFLQKRIKRTLINVLMY